MNYYYDCEFLEGTQKKTFLGFEVGHTKPTIDLISIGIVSEDGREYYEISKDFNLKEAWNRYQLEYRIVDAGRDKRNVKVYCIRENVLKPIWIYLFLQYEAEFVFLKGKAYDDFEHELKAGLHDKYFTFKSLQALIKRYGKSKRQIAYEVKTFCVQENQLDNPVIKSSSDVDYPIFYGYYSAYDHVVLCWLFGKMIDLPTGFPMYTRDLKQILDDTQERRFGLSKFKGKLANDIKELPNYPKQENEHSAIHDARFNRELHMFLNQL